MTKPTRKQLKKEYADRAERVAAYNKERVSREKDNMSTHKQDKDVDRELKAMKKIVKDYKTAT